MIQANFYKYLSLIKLVVWLLILFVDYSAINVFEDPIFAIWIFLVWSFFVAWWASYFFFYWTQKIFPRTRNNDMIEADSYKLSFLFWMYSLLNILFILVWYWNKFWWLVFLICFLLLLYILLIDKKKNVKKSE